MEIGDRMGLRGDSEGTVWGRVRTVRDCEGQCRDSTGQCGTGKEVHEVMVLERYGISKETVWGPEGTVWGHEGMA